MTDPATHLSPASRLNRAEVIIRRMRQDDLSQVAAIAAHSYAEPWPQESFRVELNSEVSQPVVAERAGEIVGFIVAWIVTDEIEIANLTVKETFRRRGLGRMLLTHVLALAQARQCATAYLEVRRSNWAARRLYESMGFNDHSLRSRYYGRTGEDAIVMQKKLTTASSFLREESNDGVV
ncbi:ribosomal protein S18-alanine N-acetyltransferase [bacterium]|nr:MAG: ribosomal-protein-alanine N-acetyltransferase [candidate division KSB1 bacterium]MBC6946908.1 ribosomal-protein-alanine N-acetyltransferase [candidate division KSB1 bacterium]MCE7941747.1 ribosomal-protein-alanine N-acetyltransferase [Chlorobi bacterium CHB1]MCL4707117.1 ribosomal protein S18-alanine N-acetyltransferase [bacterium]